MTVDPPPARAFILSVQDDDQQATLLFIDQYQRLHYGLSPTYEEIGLEFGICRMSARGRVQTLWRRGFLRTRARVRRSIVLTGKGRRTVAEADSL